jgi:hypothetical protein
MQVWSWLAISGLAIYSAYQLWQAYASGSVRWRIVSTRSDNPVSYWTSVAFYAGLLALIAASLAVRLWRVLS